MAARITLLVLSASSTTALQVPLRSVKHKTLRFVEVAERIATSEDKAETFSAGDYLATLDRFGPDSAEPSNNIIASPFDAEPNALEPNAFDAMIDEAAEEAKTMLEGAVTTTLEEIEQDRKDEAAQDAVAEVEKTISTKLDDTMQKIETAAVPMEEVVVGPVGEFLIKWGFKDDPRIPEDERIPAMQRIKDSGKAGVIAYALTEGAFWIGSVPFAIAAVTLATGSLPDFASDEGKAAIGADAFIFINFARLIVPARIAFALGLAPWVDENIVKKFGGDEQAEE
jgi:hypothetical protein